MLMVSPGGVYAAGLLVAMAKAWVGQLPTEFVNSMGQRLELDWN